ncbi:MAG: hypothetical protein J0H68_08275 [Sphingobacteriia bacterium]|nr:hypothetical protein [Sphingobacteriia bacterium]
MLKSELLSPKSFFLESVKWGLVPDCIKNYKDKQISTKEEALRFAFNILKHIRLRKEDYYPITLCYLNVLAKFQLKPKDMQKYIESIVRKNNIEPKELNRIKGMYFKNSFINYLNTHLLRQINVPQKIEAYTLFGFDINKLPKRCTTKEYRSVLEKFGHKNYYRSRRISTIYVKKENYDLVNSK